jgi:hypothetical protein
LVLQGSGPAEGFPPTKSSHVLGTSYGDCRHMIKYECTFVKYEI